MRSFFKSDDRLTNPLYIADVEDNNDPTFNYRVKVRIPVIHPDSISTEHLPWAARVDTAFMGVGDDQDLNHAIPEVGTKVLVLAIGDNLNSLVYIGSLYKKTTQTPSTEAYLNTYGIYRKDGQFIGVDKIQKLFQVLFDGDIQIDKITNMTINASKNITVVCDVANLKATTVNVQANAVNVTAPTSTFDGNVEVTGTIHAVGNISSDAEVSAKSGSVNLSTHTHPFDYNAGPSPATGQTTPGSG